jgi:PilZ domain
VSSSIPAILYWKSIVRSSPYRLHDSYPGRYILRKQVLHSRRHHKRVETPQGVWVFWRCGRAEDTSQVIDLSVGGLFIETAKVCPVDATVELHFLVEDGGIRATATVRYVKAGSGLGLQFKTVRSEDQEHFSAMVKRLTFT